MFVKPHVSTQRGAGRRRGPLHGTRRRLAARFGGRLRGSPAPAATARRTLRRAAAGAVAAGMVTALVGASSAAASAARPPGAEAHPARGLGLAQAPAGLRAAVHRTLGAPAAGAAGTWSQQAEVADPGGGAGDYFGGSVAISGTTAVVGAEGNSSGTGAAYVFTRSGSTWSKQAELTASDGAQADDFGAAVAISGTTVVVGAFGNNSNTGAAYVFTRSGTTWSQRAELTVGGADAAFGDSVAISGTTVVVGASGYNGTGTGAAYVFTGSGATWSQQATLADPGGATGDYFGDSVATTGSTAVIGADGTSSGTGAAYVFTRSGATWSQQATLADPGATAGDNFGSSVATSGTTAVIGAQGASSTGAAYVFTGSGATWSQQATLADPGGAGSEDLFGSSVAVSGSTAVIGAPDASSGTGTAYTFTRAGTSWTQQAQLTAADGGAGEYFATSVATTATTTITGAPYSNSGTGGAYIFANSSFPTKGGILFGGTDGLANLSTQLGRNMAIIRTYYKMDGATFPTIIDKQHMQVDHSTLLVSLDLSTGQTYQSIINGASNGLDSKISTFLQAVNQAAITYNLSSIFISFEHEPDSPLHAPLGTSAQFVQAWDHVHQLAENAGLDWNQGDGGRLLWALILTNHTYAVGTNADGYWPGPGEADIVAVDGYNGDGCGTNTHLQTPTSLFTPLLNFAAANGGLPSFIAEWASNAGQPSAQAAFITEMQAFLTSNHQKIKAAMYWDSATTGCNFKVDGNPGSIAALKTLGAASAIQGTAHL
jgi:hypothetical protein